MKPGPAACLSLALLAAASSAAFAETNPEIADEKSPGVALGLGLLTTAAGFGLLSEASNSDALAIIGSGLVVGGSYAGYLYTGDGAAALRLAVVQSAGVGAFALGASMTFGDGADTGSSTLGQTLLWTGAAVTVGSAVYGLVDAYRSAGRENARLRARPRTLRVAPTAVVGPRDSAGLGLGLAGSF